MFSQLKKHQTLNTCNTIYRNFNGNRALKGKLVSHAPVVLVIQPAFYNTKSYILITSKETYHRIKGGSESKGWRGETTHRRTHWMMTVVVMMGSSRTVRMVEPVSGCHLDGCSCGWVVKSAVVVVHLTGRIAGCVDSVVGGHTGDTETGGGRGSGRNGSGCCCFVQCSLRCSVMVTGCCHAGHDVLEVTQVSAASGWGGDEASAIHSAGRALLLLWFWRKFPVSCLNPFFLHRQWSVHLLYKRRKYLVLC